ncbi:GAP family protein [Schumannella luteola]
MDNPIIDALGAALPLAVGVALSPLPVIAVVLVAMSPRARVAAPLFLVGRMLGLAILLTVVIALADVLYALTSSTSIPPVIKLLLGLALIVLGLSKWRPKPKGVEPELPGWMSSLGSATPGRAFRWGVLLSLINPKELALLLAVGITVGGAPLTIGQEALVGLGVVVVASLSVAAPALAVLVAPARVAPALGTLRTWLTANSSVVMGVLLVVIGAVVAGGALGDL